MEHILFHLAISLLQGIKFSEIKSIVTWAPELEACFNFLSSSRY